MTKRKAYYLRYLESGHWKALRKETFKRDHFRCVLCGAKGKLRGHHKRYRKNLKECTVNDIVTLCEPCHEKEHKRLAHERRLNRKTNLRRLIGRFAASDIPTKVMELQTPAGGWTKESLEALGVPWPPPRGWKRRLTQAATL